jgi:hypothetical protein
MLYRSTELKVAVAQARLALLDADANPAALLFYSGGQPDEGRAIVGMAAHAVSTAYAAGDYVTAGLHYYRAENNGTSAASPPTWPTDGGTVIDNDITWQDMGEIPTLLGTLTLDQPAGSVDSAGVLTLRASTIQTVTTGGTAAWARLENGAGTWIYQGDCGLTGSGAFVELNTLELLVGGPLRPDSLTIE